MKRRNATLIFLFLILLGLVIYLLSRDSPHSDNFFVKSYERHTVRELPKTYELKLKYYKDYGIQGGFDKSAIFQFDKNEYLDILKSFKTDSLYECIPINEVSEPYYLDSTFWIMRTYRPIIHGEVSFELYFGEDSLRIGYLIKDY